MACSLQFLLLLQQAQERKKKEIVKQVIFSLNELPEELLRSPEDLQGLKDYISANDKFGDFVESNSGLFVNDLQKGRQHHDIHCISWMDDDDFNSIIGLPLRYFGNLYISLLPALKFAFPNSPHSLSPNEFHKYCSVRFKLFLTLYRNKTGSSHKLMEKIFGWSDSSLQEWHEKVLIIMVKHMHQFHKGFLSRMGPDWQMEEMLHWKLKHLAQNDYKLWQQRMVAINEECIRKHLAPRINIAEAEAGGSIGAYDATYSLRPRILASTLAAHSEDPSLDRLYSDYIKCHAFKLLILTSHGIGKRPKFILWVEFGCGGNHDSPLLVQAQTKIIQYLVKGAFGLGDHAFHGCYFVIVPVSQLQIAAAPIATDKVNLLNFNGSHSSDRMCSEHGVKYLKLWGVVRGRGEMRLYENEVLVFTVSDTLLVARDSFFFFRLDVVFDDPSTGRTRLVGGVVIIDTILRRRCHQFVSNLLPRRDGFCLFDSDFLVCPLSCLCRTDENAVKDVCQSLMLLPKVDDEPQYGVVVLHLIFDKRRSVGLAHSYLPHDILLVDRDNGVWREKHPCFYVTRTKIKIYTTTTTKRWEAQCYHLCAGIDRYAKNRDAEGFYSPEKRAAATIVLVIGLACLAAIRGTLAAPQSRVRGYQTRRRGEQLVVDLGHDLSLFGVGRGTCGSGGGRGRGRDLILLFFFGRGDLVERVQVRVEFLSSSDIFFAQWRRRHHLHTPKKNKIVHPLRHTTLDFLLRVLHVINDVAMV